MVNKNIKVAFIVGSFPRISETFIINQVADLSDRGVRVEVFSFGQGEKEKISQRFFDYKMQERTYYLNAPGNFIWRFLLALPRAGKLLFKNPKALFRALNFFKYGRNAYSLKLIFWVTPFVDKKFDLYHCHFGPMANKFLIIKDILGLDAKIITSFLGYDISSVVKSKGVAVYDRLKKESSSFIVMSNNMKERIIAQGFDKNKIKILPISIDVDSYPFKERILNENEEIRIASVGRFVEKKGFDDLLKALAIVKNKTDKKFVCKIIGDGPLKNDLYLMTKKLGLEDVVSYPGYMKLEDIIKYFLDMHFYLQPSKTATDGDME